jgi:hypothetical protein
MATAIPDYYRAYVDEREVGRDFNPQHEIDVWLTGEVIDGPTVEYDHSNADDWFRDRMDSFTLRVHHGRFPSRGDLDVLIHAHTSNQECDLPPLWLAHLRLGSLVQVRLVIIGSQDLADLHASDGQHGFMAHTVRVYADKQVMGETEGARDGSKRF